MNDKKPADFAFAPTAPAGQRFAPEPERDSIADIFPAISGKEFDAAKERAMRHLFGKPIDLIAEALQASGMDKVKP